MKYKLQEILTDKNICGAVPRKEIIGTGFGYTLSIIGGKYKMPIMYLLDESKVIRYN